MDTRKLPQMKRIKLYLLILPTVWLSGCIGTDIVEDIIVPETISINNAIDSLRIGETYTFSADYFNELGEPSQATVEWLSSDPSVISIESTGAAEALSEGNVYIKALRGENVDSVKVNAGNTTSVLANKREGTFVGRNNYSVSGDFSLMEMSGNLTLVFADNFRASNGPGLYVYLSNQPTNISGGIELGKLKKNTGAQTYSISENIQLNTYNYVIIYCKPFGVPFGTGSYN
tara:strand:- start:18970 stop:19662 length:693 start_codon:yes stop_codon:yes gene_type:complete